MDRKKIDILSPIPRRHLIDSSASSLWLEGPGDSGSASPPPAEPISTSSQRGTSLSPGPGPLLDSPITPTSPTISTLQSVHHQHSPTRTRSPSFYRDSAYSGMSMQMPTTAPAGTTKFFAQQESGVSGSSSGFIPPSQGSVPHVRAPHRRVSSQSFSTLYKQGKQQQRGKDEREGSVGPSSMRSASLLQRNYRAEVDREREKDGMGKAWIRWMHKRGIKAWIVPLLVLASTLVKFCIGLGSYSGEFVRILNRKVVDGLRRPRYTTDVRRL